MDLEEIRKFKIPAINHDYQWKDTALYALGLGYGADYQDLSELPFVYEKLLKAVPSICNTIAHPPFWLNTPELALDWMKVLHAEQGFTLHRPLPPQGCVQGKFAVKSVEDKGKDRGAILTLEKMLSDRDTGELLCTVTTAIFLRGDGGQGGFGKAQVVPGAFAAGTPDCVVDIPTLPQAALIYRLSGDVNPLHIDPAVARRAGFDRPILHGLATMGIATRALLRAVCEQDPARLLDMFVRFTSPVYPGETIRTEIYHAGEDVIRFRCRVVERDAVVLDRGQVRLRSPADMAAAA